MQSKRTKLNSPLGWLLLVLLGLTFIGCSSGKVASSNQAHQASRSIPGNDDLDNPDPETGLLADCNTIDGAEYEIGGAISTYYDPDLQNYVLDVIRMTLSSVPSELTTSDSHYMQIFAWYPSGGNNRTFSSAIRMYFMERGTGKIINESKPLVTLSRNTIQQLIVDHNLGQQGISPENFFNHYVIHLTKMDMTYDAMSIALYDVSQGNEAYGQVDVLLPAFSANPNTYAASHPETMLQTLHPFWSYRFSEWSDQQYLNASEQFCQEML